MPTPDVTCRYCGHGGQPVVDPAYDRPVWACAACGEPVECDECGGFFPLGHVADCPAAATPGRWRHPLDPEVDPPLLPAARAGDGQTLLRVLFCRRCGQETGVPGAILCAACWPLVEPDVRAVLGYGHPLVDPTAVPG